MNDLPRTVEEVDLAWLRGALGAERPGREITGMRIVEVIHGACTKLRIEIDAEHDFLPRRVIMKAGFEPHSEAMAHMHANEMHAYRDFVPTIETNSPRCLLAAEDSHGRTLVILEDLALRDVEFQSLHRPLDRSTAAAFLEGLARQHARWWGEKSSLLARFPWLPDTSEARFHHYFAILNDAARFAEFAERPRCAAMPRELLDPTRIRAAHAAMRVHHETMPFTVLHGDMHLGNLYRDADGRPGFLDWQPRLAPWSVDVSYFLVAGLDLVDRRHWERDLLRHYLAALTRHGIDAPSFEEAFAAYRRDIIWGLLIWMLNGWQFQTEAVNTAAASRFAMAMIDHDVFAELGV